MVCTKCNGEIHGDGEKGRTVTSLGCLGGRHLNEVRVGSGEEGRAGILRPEEQHISPVRWQSRTRDCQVGGR